MFFSDVNECNTEGLNDCTQGCLNLYGGYSCECDTGYRLLTDEVTCESE